MKTEYDLNSKFDIEQHKKKYVNYLEVIIFPDGHIEYAVPSHQEKLIAVCREKLRVSRDELNDRCPEEYYCDFITWLCNISECVSVWNDFIIKSDCIPMTSQQIRSLNQLKEAGLYGGNVC